MRVPLSRLGGAESCTMPDRAMLKHYCNFRHGDLRRSRTTVERFILPSNLHGLVLDFNIASFRSPSVQRVRVFPNCCNYSTAESLQGSHHMSRLAQTTLATCVNCRKRANVNGRNLEARFSSYVTSNVSQWNMSMMCRGIVFAPCLSELQTNEMFVLLLFFCGIPYIQFSQRSDPKQTGTPNVIPSLARPFFTWSRRDVRGGRR